MEKAFEKLRLDEKLNKQEENALTAFADKFVTCTLNPDMAAKMMNETASASEGIKIVKIAKETQQHHHTKTCKVCEVFENGEEMDQIWKDYDKQKETKDEYVTNRKERNLKVLELAGISPKCYIEAVQEQSRKGVNIILARDIDEIYINDYNPEWIEA